MRIYITGICGYLGSSLAIDLLKKGHSVGGLDNLMYEQDMERILDSFSNFDTAPAVQILDIRNRDFLFKELDEFLPDVMVHFGDLSSVYSCNHNPRLTESISIQGTGNILEYCAKRSIPLIYNSTSSVYGSRPDRRLMLESDILDEPSDQYCAAKLKIERLLNDLSQEHKNFKFITFRPATVFGVSPRFRIELLPNHFVYSAISKKVIYVSNQNAARAFISIKTIGQIYAKVIEVGIFNNSTYNIGSYNLTKLEVALHIQELTDARIETIPDIGDLRNLRISSKSFENDHFNIPHSSFKDEIAHVIDYTKENKKSIENTNFSGLLNMPLENWMRLN